MKPLDVTFAMRLGRGLNDRETHWRQRTRRVKNERLSTSWALVSQDQPETPCTIRITRIAPSNGLDDDGLSGACKGVRDQVAEWMGVDDRHIDVVRYVYAQQRGPWAVRIEVVA